MTKKSKHLTMSELNMAHLRSELNVLQQKNQDLQNNISALDLQKSESENIVIKARKVKEEREANYEDPGEMSETQFLQNSEKLKSTPENESEMLKDKELEMAVQVFTGKSEEMVELLETAINSLTAQMRCKLYSNMLLFVKIRQH